MKRLVSGYMGVSYTRGTHVGKSAFSAWVESALAQRMGVVPLTQCQPLSAARHRRSTWAWKDDKFFLQPASVLHMS